MFTWVVVLEDAYIAAGGYKDSGLRSLEAGRTPSRRKDIEKVSMDPSPIPAVQIQPESKTA